MRLSPRVSITHVSYVACLLHPDLLRRPEAEDVVRRSYVPRRAVWLFLRDPKTLTANERADLWCQQPLYPASADEWNSVYQHGLWRHRPRRRASLLLPVRLF